ncbi:helix-turn-helix domain-containing protein [Streptomyces erythrochromogenes]|uniref:helix-turn-helix domain-containing protein n=1 Tax=Streptomyces erythrochromogenes TaxID=285574 RepID=UPI0036A0D21E
MPTDPPAWVLTRRQVIGARIRAARTDADLTQEALGERVGIDNKTVHRIEYAISDPTLTVLLGIAKATGVPLADLVRE